MVKMRPTDLIYFKMLISLAIMNLEWRFLILPKKQVLVLSVTLQLWIPFGKKEKREKAELNKQHTLYRHFLVYGRMCVSSFLDNHSRRRLLLFVFIGLSCFCNQLT